MDVVLKKYFWAVNLLVIAVCAALAGRAAAHLIEQNWLLGDDAASQGQGKPRSFVAGPAEHVHGKDITNILDRNVFCSACAPEVEEKKEVKPGGGDAVKSALPFELVSTMWVPNEPRWSMAVIRDTGGKEKDSFMLNAGKVIPTTQVEIKRVDPRRVYVLNNGAIEYFEMEGAETKKEEPPQQQFAANGPPTGGMDPLDNDVQKGVRCNGPNCEVDRPLLDKLLANTTGLATAARFVPSMKDGRPNGFKLYAIRPSSIFGKIGLQNGDTIKSINGMEMSSPDQALGVYSKLRSASHLSVSVERRGETVTLDYTIR